MRNDSESIHRSLGRAMLSIGFVTVLGVFAGCSSGSGEPHDTQTSSPAPIVTPTTAQEVSALAEEIPVEGNDMMPLRWRLTGVKDPALEAPLLVTRQFISAQRVIFTDAHPLRWLPRLLAVGEEPSENYVDLLRKKTYRPWEELSAGPSWIWIMAAKIQGTGKVLISYCIDDGWHGKATSPPTRREGIGGIETAEVTYLKNFPGGPVWKVTDTWSLDDQAVNKPYLKQCDAWWETHTSAEGWTLPASATASTTGSPGS